MSTNCETFHTISVVEINFCLISHIVKVRKLTNIIGMLLDQSLFRIPFDGVSLDKLDEERV